MKIHTYAVLMFKPSFAYNGPGKTVPTCAKALEQEILSSDNWPIFRAERLTHCLWQATDLLITRLTSCLP